MDDKFVLLRQKINENLAEDDFDPDGTLASKMLGSNAAYHIDQITPAIKNLGMPKRVSIEGRHKGQEIPQMNSARSKMELDEFDAKKHKSADAKMISQKLEEFFGSASRCVSPNPVASSYSFQSFKKDERFLNDLRGEDDLETFKFNKKFTSKSFIETPKNNFQSKWSKEVHKSKEISRDIVAEMFKNSNVFLDDNLVDEKTLFDQFTERPLPFDKRFNNGDSTYRYNSAKGDDEALMEKLVQHATKSVDMLTETDDSVTDVTLNPFNKSSKNVTASLRNNSNKNYREGGGGKSVSYDTYVSKIPRSRNNQNNTDVNDLDEAAASSSSSSSSSDGEDSSLWFAMRQNFSNNVQNAEK
ncbi:hypothetical protein HELRODRAFT_166366 [Helobdella robusta]|uniref:Uncharacterized protein n=1 Tax=Helobdella robusta TaxID=6412 RepID=T1EY23_HELRO|nr:hypothetical protein HELRODRAFT_166366 [Helobdella robusta]ESN90662.1 hypothetical protein HELRODRAFT_166366 [Helobdella robusta]